MKKSGKWRKTLYQVSILCVFVVITLAVTACLSTSGSSGIAAASIPRDIKSRTLSISEGVKTPTATSTPRAAATMAPRQPAAPPPSRTLPRTNIYIPVVEKEGDPYSFKTRLPLLIKADPTPPPSTSNPETEVHFKEKTILVDISDQHVYAYDKGKLIFSFAASTGRKNLTRIGRYKILDKIPNAYSDPWGFWMPYWMGIYYAGYNLENGFHSLPVLSNGATLWGNKIGSPVTYGCVVLLPDDMKKLYRWAGIGTAVVIQR